MIFESKQFLWYYKLMKNKSFLLRKTIFLLSALILMPCFVKAETAGSSMTFNIDKSYDQLSREKIGAVLISVSDRAYFYIEKDYYNEQTQAQQNIIKANINELANEFDNVIYPKLTKFYGSEWNPGIDDDRRITILLHLMNSDYAGYFKEKDEYYKQQFPESNQREMLYSNIYYLGKDIAKSYLAHEFTHLITFNNKNRILNVSEDTWITEMRSEYAPTLCGYNDNYSGSVLSVRVKRFLANPTNSLTKWGNTLDDYATIDLFAHYFADHYGYGFLYKSLYSKTSDYKIFEEYLKSKGISKDFKSVYLDWQIANLINDCSVKQYYCYTTPSLKTFKINPRVNFLPYTGESSLSVFDKIENWSSRWYKIVGGDGIFEFEFKGLKGVNFVVPILLEKKTGGYVVGNLEINDDATGKYNVLHFSDNYKAFYFIPSILNDPKEKSEDFSFSWTGTSKESKNPAPPPEIIQDNQTNAQKIAGLESQLAILRQKLVELLEAKITELKAQIAVLLANKR
jgi:hypothetical protein